jgi:hypothetical protein
MDKLTTLIDAYCTAWSEADAAQRERQLAQVLEADVRYTDPRADTTGVAQLSVHIGAVLAKRPGARVVRTSGVDAHHHLARFAWRVVQADGSMLPEGIDVVAFSSSGKLCRIVGFFGPLAPIPLAGPATA